MTVELTWATPNAEALIVEMARVSAPENQSNLDTAPRLLKYLIRNHHWSPFEMGNMCVKIHTERDISAQILRHRSFSFQEYSTRYAEAQAYTMPQYRRQDFANRQNSIDDLSPSMLDELTRLTDQALTNVDSIYRRMLSLGVAKETARRILPLCTKTTLYMNGTLRSWIHYLQLRTHESTQLEHRLIAKQIQAIFMEQFSVIAEAAFETHN